MSEALPVELEFAERFVSWLKALKDRKAQRAIAQRLTRMRAGAFGDSKAIGEGVHELRVHLGAGYRV